MGDGLDAYTCDCVAGFEGTHCETNIDNCVGVTSCQNGGTCVDGINNYTCNCAEGFTGAFCENSNSALVNTTLATSDSDGLETWHIVIIILVVLFLLCCMATLC